jgi:hypothetical protein
MFQDAQPSCWAFVYVLTAIPFRPSRIVTGPCTYLSKAERGRKPRELVLSGGKAPQCSCYWAEKSEQIMAYCLGPVRRARTFGRETPAGEATVSLKATESRRPAAKRGIMDKGGIW